MEFLHVPLATTQLNKYVKFSYTNITVRTSCFFSLPRRSSAVALTIADYVLLCYTASKPVTDPLVRAHLKVVQKKSRGRHRVTALQCYTKKCTEEWPVLLLLKSRLPSLVSQLGHTNSVSGAWMARLRMHFLIRPLDQSQISTKLSMHGSQQKFQDGHTFLDFSQYSQRPQKLIRFTNKQKNLAKDISNLEFLTPHRNNLSFA